MRGRRKTADTEVFVVTSAQRGRSEDVDDRSRRYAIKMGIRTICLLLAVFVSIPWLRGIFIVAAIALPWFSVIAANGAPVQGTAMMTALPAAPSPPSLGPGTAPDG